MSEGKAKFSTKRRRASTTYAAVAPVRSARSCTLRRSRASPRSMLSAITSVSRFSRIQGMATEVSRPPL